MFKVKRSETNNLEIFTYKLLWEMAWRCKINDNFMDIKLRSGEKLVTKVGEKTHKKCRVPIYNKDI